MHFHKHSCVSFSLHEAWFVHYKSISYIFYHILSVHVQEWVIVCMHCLKWTPCMKRLFSGRSMIVPLPLCSYHPSLCQKILQFLSLFLTTENKLVWAKQPLNRVHTTVTQYFLSLTPETVFSTILATKKNEVNSPSTYLVQTDTCNPVLVYIKQRCHLT